jgi:hypothetical protein
MPKGSAGGRFLPVRDVATGLIVDGRDRHLANLVYAAWSANPSATAEEVAEVAWDRFRDHGRARAAETQRGRPWPWSPADAERKARAIVRRGECGSVKSAGKLRPHRLGEEIPEAIAQAFAEYCRARLTSKSDSAVRVSDFMVARLTGGACIDAVSYIATALEMNERTVERARAKLLEKHLWTTALRLGTRDQTAPYYPSSRILAQLARNTKEITVVATANPTNCHPTI